MEYLDVNKRGFYESLIIFHSYKRIYITQVFRSHIIHPSALKDAHSKDTNVFLKSNVIRAYLNTRKKQPLHLSSAKIYSIIRRACSEHCEK